MKKTLALTAVAAFAATGVHAGNANLDRAPDRELNANLDRTEKTDGYWPTLFEDEAPAPAPAPEPVPVVVPEPVAPPVITPPVIDPVPVMRFENVHFALDSAVIDASDLDELAKAKAIISNESGTRFVVVGHTDSTGTDAYNQQLSERRANAVRNWLISHGVSADRLVAVGMGESRPTATNATREGRAQNRRVELNRAR